MLPSPTTTTTEKDNRTFPRAASCRRVRETPIQLPSAAKADRAAMQHAAGKLELDVDIFAQQRSVNNNGRSECVARYTERDRVHPRGRTIYSFLVFLLFFFFVLPSNIHSGVRLLDSEKRPNGPGERYKFVPRISLLYFGCHCLVVCSTRKKKLCV
uniref:Uncharacterized protein n=1 Tax=Trichogramma kaykai TaxID=54128 RepID=A0ABD2VYE7_9HYME